MSHIEILATGHALITKGIRGIEPVMEEIIKEAKSEIQILAYMFTAQAHHILNLVEKAAEKGVKITIIVNNLSSQAPTIKSKLKTLAGKFSHVKVFDFIDPKKGHLHAKILVIDRKKALIGSANFSWGGMFSNYEICVLIEDENVWTLAQAVDILTQLSRKIKS
jgi:cardiolipin synthase